MQRAWAVKPGVSWTASPRPEAQIPRGAAVGAVAKTCGGGTARSFGVKAIITNYFVYIYIFIIWLSYIYIVIYDDCICDVHAASTKLAFKGSIHIHSSSKKIELVCGVLV